MGITVDTVILVLIVAVAVCWLGRSVYRTFTGKQVGCACWDCDASCAGCGEEVETDTAAVEQNDGKSET